MAYSGQSGESIRWPPALDPGARGLGTFRTIGRCRSACHRHFPTTFDFPVQPISCRLPRRFCRGSGPAEAGTPTVGAGRPFPNFDCYGRRSPRSSTAGRLSTARSCSRCMDARAERAIIFRSRVRGDSSATWCTSRVGSRRRRSAGLFDVDGARRPTSAALGAAVVVLPLHEGLRAGRRGARPACGGRCWNFPGRGCTSTPG